MKVLTLTLGLTQTNCFIAADEQAKEAAVVDPGWDAAQVLGALRQNGWQAKVVLLTHAHFDHIGAVAGVVEATGAPLAMHRLDLPWLRNAGGAQALGIAMRLPPDPDLYLEPGQVLEVGGLRFEVLFVPGHTPGHVVFYEPRAKAVFSGDVLFREGIGRTDLPGGDYDTLMRSIRDVMLSLPDDTTVYPGHGPATTIGAERRDNPFLI